MPCAETRAALVAAILGASACGGDGAVGPAAVSGVSSTPARPSSGRWVTGYYPAYATGTMPIAAIPFASMTHVIHFALVPNADGTLADPVGVRAQTSALVSAGRGAGVRVLLGVGGDASVGAPAGFQGSTSAANRASFVANIVEAVSGGGYDGVDVNWESIEFPRDVANFRAFIRDLRTALDQRASGTRPLLTYPAGTSSSFTEYANHAEMVAPVQDLFDQINLQTYVMAGPYPGWVTWHNSPLTAGGCRFATTGAAPPSIDATVQAFVAAGIPRGRIGIGLQLVGVDWSGGNGTATGRVTRPCQAWDYSRPKPDGSGQDIGAPSYAGGWTFLPAAEVMRRLTPANGYAARFDDAAGAAYLSKDEPDGAGDHFVSYETAQSIRAKTEYLQAQGLGGVIVFEITQDYLAEQPAGDAQHPLMSAVRQAVRQ